jgi:hypothetical protein
MRTLNLQRDWTSKNVEELLARLASVAVPVDNVLVMERVKAALREPYEATDTERAQAMDSNFNEHGGELSEEDFAEALIS